VRPHPQPWTLLAAAGVSGWPRGPEALLGRGRVASSTGSCGEPSTNAYRPVLGALNVRVSLRTRHDLEPSADLNGGWEPTTLLGSTCSVRRTELSSKAVQDAGERGSFSGVALPPSARSNTPEGWLPFIGGHRHPVFEITHGDGAGEWPAP
jgi:hypothetical protein